MKRGTWLGDSILQESRPEKDGTDYCAFESDATVLWRIIVAMAMTMHSALLGRLAIRDTTYYCYLTSRALHTVIGV